VLVETGGLEPPTPALQSRSGLSDVVHPHASAQVSWGAVIHDRPPLTAAVQPVGCTIGCTPRAPPRACGSSR
jgi:hypothetical protein